MQATARSRPSGEADDLAVYNARMSNGLVGGHFRDEDRKLSAAQADATMRRARQKSTLARACNSAPISAGTSPAHARA